MVGCMCVCVYECICARSLLTQSTATESSVTPERSKSMAGV